MKKEFFTIGRDDSSDILLYGDLTSREHATLRYSKRGKYIILDHSTNGTFVNGTQLQNGVEYEISRNDNVDFAHSEVLDWQLVPKKSLFGRKLIWIIAAAIVVTALAIGVVYFFKTFDIARKQAPMVEESVPVQRDTTTTVKDTVTATAPVVIPQTETKAAASKKQARKAAAKAEETSASEKDSEKKDTEAASKTAESQTQSIEPEQPLF